MWPQVYLVVFNAYIILINRSQEAPMRFFFRVRTKETTSEELPEVPLRRSPSINSRQAPVATGETTPEVKEEHKEENAKASTEAVAEHKPPPKQGNHTKKDISDKCIKIEKNVSSVVEKEKVVKLTKNSGKKNYEDCVKSEKKEKEGNVVKVKKEKVSQGEGGKKCENIKLKIGLSKDNSKMMVIKDITPNPAKTPTPTKTPAPAKASTPTKTPTPPPPAPAATPISKSTREKIPQVSVKIEKSPEAESALARKPKAPTVEIPIQKTVKQEPKSPTELREYQVPSPHRTPIKIEAKEKTTENQSDLTTKSSKSPSPSIDSELTTDLEEIKKSQFLNSFELTAKTKTDVPKSPKSTVIPKSESTASKRKNKDPVKSVVKNRLPELPNLVSQIPAKETESSKITFDLSPFPINSEKNDKKPPVTNGFVVPKTDPPPKRPKKDETTVPRRKYTNFVKIAPKQSASTAASLMNSAAFIGGSGTSKLSMRSSSTPSRIAPPRRQSVATDNPSRILQDTFSMLQKNSTEIKKIDAGKDAKVYGPQMGPPPPPGLPMPRTPNHVPEYWNYSMRNGSATSKGYVTSPYLGLSSPIYTPNYSPNSPQYAPTYNIPISQSQFKYTGLPTNGTSSLPRTLGKTSEKETTESSTKKNSNEVGESAKRAKSKSPTTDDGEPPEKQRKVQSLLNSCNITFPSSLSITLTNEQNDTEANKSCKSTKLKRPVNNYIEILKLPSDGATTVTPIPATTAANTSTEDTRNGKISPKDTGKSKDLLTKVSELTTKAAESSKKIDREGESDKNSKKQLPKLNPIDKASSALTTTEGGAESFQQTYLMSLLNQSGYKDKMQNKLYDLKTNKIIPLDGTVTSSTSPENRPSPPPAKKSKSEPSSLVKNSHKDNPKPTKSASALDLSSVTSSVESEPREKKPKESKRSPSLAPKGDLPEPNLKNLLPTLPLIPPASPELLMAGLAPGFPNPLNYPAFWMEQYNRMKKAGSEALELYFQNIQKNMAKAKGNSEPHTPPASTPTTISSTVKEADK